jgi:acetylornithine/N-succinyldiaminopimelate aminotransferase
VESLRNADKLKNDPRVEEAKKLLLEAVENQQMHITGIKAANPALKRDYDAVINSFIEQRGGNIYYPYIGSGIGKGALVELLDGSIKYDFIAGVGVHHFGHNHPEIMATAIDASISDTIMQGALQQNIDTVELTNLLINESNLDHCYITTSGAFANENALKIALQKKSPASRILSFEKCFAGRTLVLLDVSDKAANREGMPIYAQVDYIPFFDPSKPKESTKKAVDSLKKHLSRYPKQHAVMLFELIQGEGGCNPGSKAFFQALMKILRENDIAILIDEVQTFGRTSKIFAFQHFELEEYADIVTIGKLAQVCATLYRKEWKPKAGLITQTFTNSTVAIKVAKTIIHLMLRDRFFGEDGKNMSVNKHFSKNLDDISHRLPKTITGPYGLGAMIAFTPFEGKADKTKEFNMTLFHEGLICFSAGSDPYRTRFLPPIGAITSEDIDVACNIVEKTLRKLCT